MKKVWNFINGLNATKDSKRRLFICGQVMLYTLIGAVVWALFGRVLLPGVDWLLCFVGYPAVFIGFFGGVLYLYNNEFT